jgi:GWxTD domain-containing protein
MSTVPRLVVALHVAAALCGAARSAASQDDWSKSPEAEFLTADERRAWKALRSEEEREQFKEQYWAERDSIRDTPENEFRDVVRARIDEADRQFAVGETPGSLTQRGRVFVLLGPPAAVRVLSGPLDSNPKREGPIVVLPRSALDARAWHTWIYDREKNRDVMTVLKRRNLELTFVVRPGRDDEIQNAILFSRVRQEIAEASKKEGERERR